MKRFLSLTMCLAMVLAVGNAQAATKSTDVDVSDLNFVVDGEGTVLYSATKGQDMLMRVSGPDTFDLYGGDGVGRSNPNAGAPGIRGQIRTNIAPGETYVEGKFQDATGFAPAGLRRTTGQSQADKISQWVADGTPTWIGVDLTDQEAYWNLSTYFMENLGTDTATGNGAGNKGMWSGLDATDGRTEGWLNIPGYGDNWNDVLLFEIPVGLTSTIQNVALDFRFNAFTEGGYDFFNVEYDSAGVWTSVYEFSGITATTIDGYNSVFPDQGTQFSTVQTGTIAYTGGDYAEYRDGNGDIVSGVRVRLRFGSDGAFSMEDGLFAGPGAIQVDDISISIPSEGTFFEDFEGANPANFLWQPTKADYAGDFAQIFSGFDDIDPCAENVTPMAGFIDNGVNPTNDPGLFPGSVIPPYAGNSSSGTWNYGINTRNVFNYTGGLTGGEVPMDNEIWSPEFDWDVAGTTADNDPAVSGSRVNFTVWRHNPLLNGVFYTWAVRARAPQDINDPQSPIVWGPWTNAGFVYFSATGEYLNSTFGTTDLIPQGVEKVQIALGGTDLADAFAFPGADATPAPLFDDVRFYKYRIGGIAMSTRTIDLAQDGFPVRGVSDFSVALNRDDADIRFDMARDINTGTDLVPGDSIIVNASAVIPGTNLVDIRMKWALLQNPLFTQRVAPARDGSQDDGLVDVDVTAPVAAAKAGWTITTGTVTMQQSVGAASGTPVPDTYYADLPDLDFMYPGDILHYYIEAEDNLTNLTVLGGNTDNFGIWDAENQSAYSRTYTVRGLPSVVDANNNQPSILLYNDFGRRGGEAEFVSMFNQLALLEGRDWDSFTTQGPSSGVSNGIGSPGTTGPITDDGGNLRGHGAIPPQLGGYSTIVYLSGNLSTQLMSDGSDDNANNKADDLGVLREFKALAGQRNTVYFGDFVGSATAVDSPVDGSDYVSNVMGITVVNSDVRAELGGQTSPRVQSTGVVQIPGGGGSAFSQEFIAYGGCFGINQFDSIRAGGNSQIGHAFLDANGTPIPTIAASVVFDRDVDDGQGGFDRKVDITFPFGDLYVYDPGPQSTGGLSSRSILMQEILNFLGETVPGAGNAVAAPALRAAKVDLYPNPFNPKTTVAFQLPKQGVEAAVKIYNVRGELVKTLFDGVAGEADLVLEWNGTDNRGGNVASGLYLVKAVTEGFSDTKKAVLVK